MADHQFPHIPKVGEYGQIQLVNGTVMKGHIFVEATSRIQDVLNKLAPFMPLIDEGAVVHTINKSAVMKVRTFD